MNVQCAEPHSNETFIDVIHIGHYQEMRIITHIERRYVSQSYKTGLTGSQCTYNDNKRRKTTRQGWIYRERDKGCMEKMNIRTLKEKIQNRRNELMTCHFTCFGGCSSWDYIMQNAKQKFQYKEEHYKTVPITNQWEGKIYILTLI